MSTLKELELLLTRGTITRREFIARVTALGLAAAVSPALMRGTARASAPKKGGRFKIGITGGSTTDSMDPATLTSNMNQNVNWQIRNDLVEIDYNFNAIPELAESWDSTPDAKVWSFKLPQGRRISQWQNHDSRRCDFFHKPPFGRKIQICSQRVFKKS